MQHPNFEGQEQDFSFGPPEYQHQRNMDGQRRFSYSPPFESRVYFRHSSSPVFPPYDNNFTRYGMPFRHQSHFNRMRYRRPYHLQRQRFPEPHDPRFRFDFSENSPMYQPGYEPLPLQSTFSDDCDEMMNLPETRVKRISLGDCKVARRLQFDDEEYEPMPISGRRYSLVSLESTANLSSTEDDDSSSSSSLPSKSEFQTAYVAAVVAYVQIGKQRTERRSAYGIWSDNSDLNFASIMPSTRPQCLKATLIYAGAECVCRFKEKGINRANISMDSDFLVKNVTQWLKHLENGKIDDTTASNWDEYKYASEIVQLCDSFTNMRINWVNTSGKCEGIDKAKKLANEAIKNNGSKL